MNRELNQKLEECRALLEAEEECVECDEELDEEANWKMLKGAVSNIKKHLIGIGKGAREKDIKAVKGHYDLMMRSVQGLPSYMKD